jgi:hypothetical protein
VRSSQIRANVSSRGDALSRQQQNSTALEILDVIRVRSQLTPNIHPLSMGFDPFLMVLYVLDSSKSYVQSTR